MRRLLLVSFFLICMHCTFAQIAIEESERQEIIKKVDKYAQSIQTIKCDFTQTKKLSLLNRSIESKGNMLYCRPNKMRWQYTSPFDYTLVLNQGKAKMISNNKATSIGIDNKLFQQITETIMNCITGGSLKNSTYFETTIYKKDGTFMAQMAPQKKEIKRIYKSIVLYFNHELSMISKIELIESSGDSTCIVLNNVTTNIPINETCFDSN